jgi:FixJ family two-component response regulator
MRVKLSKPIVFVVDDDTGIREALASLIGSIGLRVECFASSQEFLRGRNGDSPSCLVLDVRMPGLSGFELQRELERVQRSIPIIYITAHGDIPMAVQAMKAGAIDFLSKPFRDEDLLDAIRKALDSDAAFRVRQAELGEIRSRIAQLTARQRQIMTHVVAGRLNKQTAAELGVSENTIKVHRHRIMERMGAASLADLIHMLERLS